MRRLVLIISARALAGRRTLLRWSAPLAVMIALGAPAGALGSVDVETIHFAGSVTQAGANPCTGAAGTFCVSFTGVSHTNVTAGGTLHHTATVTGAIAFTPNDPNQATYTRRLTAWDGPSGAAA